MVYTSHPDTPLYRSDVDVDFDLLTRQEFKFKACRDLFQIFFTTRNSGLTDLEIYNKALELNITGYSGMTPDCIVRSNIYR